MQVLRRAPGPGDEKTARLTNQPGRSVIYRFATDLSVLRSGRSLRNDQSEVALVRLNPVTMPRHQSVRAGPAVGYTDVYQTLVLVVPPVTDAVDPALVENASYMVQYTVATVVDYHVREVGVVVLRLADDHPAGAQMPIH